MLNNTSKILRVKNKLKLVRLVCPIGKSQCYISKQTKPYVYFKGSSMFHRGVESRKGEPVLTNQLQKHLKNKINKQNKKP